jgi:hypothetical protein
MSYIFLGRRQTNAMNAPSSQPIAKRPRQQGDRDCVVVVFREVTGEEEQTAGLRFKQFRTGNDGFTMADLSACFMEAGWMMVRDGRVIPQWEPAFSTFWKSFTGQGILEYSVEGAGTGHVVVVRSGGLVFDPAPTAPEGGEFISDHLKQYQGQLNFSLSTVLGP